jgi:hypothetical protein
MSNSNRIKFNPSPNVMPETNIFLPKLLKLAEQKSSTLMEILHIKSLDDDGIEDVNDLDYLQKACAVLAEGFILGIDKGEITFDSDSSRKNFLWLLQLLTDIAAGGKMEDLFVASGL